MATSNRDRVDRALGLLAQGLRPFVFRTMKAAFPTNVDQIAARSMPGRGGGEPNWTDSQFLLKVILDNWNDAFYNALGRSDRTLANELLDVRNRWAHNEAFTTDTAYRALDSISLLLRSISAEEAQEVEKWKFEVMRLRFEEQTKKETKRASAAALEGQPMGGLKPWRSLITPHNDVATGNFKNAEFAADLNQIYQDDPNAAEEYRDPTEFFRRTYLTEGLRTLLCNALRRLSGQGGDPVVELQTNFGGGKTHSMLALFHLSAGGAAETLPGIEDALRVAEVKSPPKARRAVLVGTALSPAHTYTKPDGVTVHTLWGEMAYQLLGKEGYALVADADRAGVSPGSDALRALFTKAAPCLILIDEWIAYVRQLYGVSGQPAGSFDANLTFAQALTEAARAVPKCLVVASLPASDIEIGGEGGREALTRLRNTFARMESAWRPANMEESFEIVRSRLFQPLDPANHSARDAVIREFMKLYSDQSQEFPSESGRADYERMMKTAYPVHPELFDRLYNDWATLEKFQRTRGVLRLMAAVIHELWNRQDASLMILPASVPLDFGPVQSELSYYLEPTWVPVIERDVDGPNSLSLRIDTDNPNLSRYSASRRVARAIFMGSAPTLNTANRGIEDRRIRLGCVQPGESVPVFNDALRRLSDAATHLYLDGGRYWYSTQPTVTRLAEERAAAVDPYEVNTEIVRRLQEETRDKSKRGDFAGVHVAVGSGDIPDEREARLVLLGPEHPHAAKNPTSPARQEAAKVLDARGSSPRRYRNALVFLAPDQTRLGELEGAVRQYMAWKSIAEESDALNLDAHQRGQAQAKHKGSDETVQSRIPETFCWLLVPTQSDPTGPVEWEDLRLSGGLDPLAVRAGKRLKGDGLLATDLGGVNLRRQLDKIPLWRDDQVSVRQLEEDFAQYIYLDRLKDPSVLHRAIEDGLRLLTWELDSFAYAEGWDPEKGRYQGLRAGQGSVASVAGGLLVKPDYASIQIEQDAKARQTSTGYTSTSTSSGTSHVADGPGGPGAGLLERNDKTAERKKRRFHGTVELNPLKMSSETGAIAQEVVQHLSGLVGAKVKVTLEIEATVEDGAPEHVIRAVTENCRTLKFQPYGFEDE